MVGLMPSPEKTHELAQRCLRASRWCHIILRIRMFWLEVY